MNSIVKSLVDIAFTRLFLYYNFKDFTGEKMIMAENKHVKKSIIYKIVLTLLLLSIFTAAFLFSEQEWIINTLSIIFLIVLWFPRKSN